MKKQNIIQSIPKILVSIFLVSLIYYFSDALGMTLPYFTEMTNIIIVSASALATLLAIYIYKKGEFDHDLKIIWLSFIAGIGLWLLGEIAWMAYEIALGIDVPYPSIGDLFWIAGYFPLMYALHKQNSSIFCDKKKYKNIAIAALALIFAITVLFVYHYTSIQDFNSIEAILGIAYPLLDIALLSMSLKMLSMTYKSKTLGKPWLFLSTGFVFITIFDILFSYLTSIELYEIFRIIDVTYITGYIFIGFGFYYFMRNILEYRKNN